MKNSAQPPITTLQKNKAIKKTKKFKKSRHKKEVQ